jgi:ParB family transcriptional regulator, chromosome partitioning protein
MELRRVDPRTLKANTNNPRKIQPGEMSDAALKATINVVGIIQPPTVAEQDGDLTIVYGSRRVRLAIELGLPEINVLVKDPTITTRCAASSRTSHAPLWPPSTFGERSKA